jgi:hypothetical protein
MCAVELRLLPSAPKSSAMPGVSKFDEITGNYRGLKMAKNFFVALILTLACQNDSD